MQAQIKQFSTPPLPLHGAGGTAMSTLTPTATPPAWTPEEEATIVHLMTTESLTRPQAVRKFRNLEKAGKLPATLRILRAADDPTLNAEQLAEQKKAERLAALEVEAFKAIDDCEAIALRGREANIRLGRIWNEQKRLIDHGKWEPYFKAKYAPRGYSLRTAQSYMKLAKEADTGTAKNANSALFPPATDTNATAMQNAVTAAKEQVAGACDNTVTETANPPRQADPKPAKKSRKPRLRLNGSYNLPLWLTGEQKDNTDALMGSQNWPGAERAIVATLDRLFIQHGLVNPPMPGQIDVKPNSPLTEVETREAMSKTRKKLKLLAESDKPSAPYTATNDDLPRSIQEMEEVEFDHQVPLNSQLAHST
jgi:hypothetical protein